MLRKILMGFFLTLIMFTAGIYTHFLATQDWTFSRLPYPILNIGFFGGCSNACPPGKICAGYCKFDHMTLIPHRFYTASNPLFSSHSKRETPRIVIGVGIPGEEGWWDHLSNYMYLP